MSIKRIPPPAWLTAAIIALFLIGAVAYFTPDTNAQRTASNPLGAQLTVVDAGTCSTTNSFAWQTLPTNAGTTTLNLSGTFTATVTVRESNNGGGTWSTAATLTTTGTTTYLTNGFTDFCADVTAFTSGIVQVSIATGLQIVQTVQTVQSVSPNNPLPASSSGPGPVFNVKNYGAKGDSQTTNNGACTSTASTTITCTGTAFSSATDVGKNWFCSNGTSDFYNALTKIVTVNSPTSITTDQPSLFNSFTCTGVWGTIDDTAISTAVTAALAASKGVNTLGNKGIFSAAPYLYFPSGGYLVCTLMLNGMVVLGSTVDGFTIAGDGSDHSFVYTGAANGGAICPSTGNSTLGSFVQVASGANNIKIKGLTFDGVNQFDGTGNALSVGGTALLTDVTVQRWAGNAQAALNVNGGNIYAVNVATFTNNGPGFVCNGCTGVWESGGSSNNGNSVNLNISNVVGSNTGLGFRLGKGVLIDECGSNAIGCTQIINSHDVWFEGPALFGTSSGFCVNVDANSYLHWDGGICGTFGNDINANGPKIQAGGTLEESSVRNIGTGSGKCVTNSGVFLDNGDNTCENMYPVTSSTSTGTTAVLTVSNPSSVAPNTNCTVGDSLLVEGNSVAGYNGYFPAGITAVSATTITYLTQGSNIGAGAGGSVTCRNLQSYSGTLPKALLNNPIPNTCHLTITPITNATTFNLCNWGAGSPTNITRITASSQVVTACTTAPIITISNGTVSQTLTLTSGKQFWDSFNAQDLSTGVGTTIFKPSISLTGTDRITVKYDVAAASACTTPPTNLAVSYTISPILSN